MRNTFFKNLFRDIRKTLSRFLSIVAIITIGVAFYAGVRATSPSMKSSGDTYFVNNNFMDFKLVSTLGLTSEDLSEIQKIKGITQAEGAFSVDALIEREQRQLVMNVNSLPKENGINSIRMVKGKRPQLPNEAVIEDRFLEDYKLKLGDSIVLIAGSDKKIEDSLKNNEFKIVGTAASPLYVSDQRQPSSIGNGIVKGFVYILPEVFKNEVYTEMYVRCDSPESRASLLNNKGYMSFTEDVENRLKDIGVTRGEIRYAEVLKSGTDKIAEAQAKLDSSRKEAENKFAEGYRQLKDGSDKILKGRAELANNEAAFNRTISDSTKQLEEGKKQLKAGTEEIAAKRKEIEEGKLQIAAGRKQLSDSEAQLKAGKTQAYEGVAAGILKEIENIKKLMETTEGSDQYAYQYAYLKQLYDNYIVGKDFDSMYISLKRDNQLEGLKAYFDLEAMKADFDKAGAEIAEGRAQLEDNEEKLLSGEAELNRGLAELNDNKKKLEISEMELAKGKAEAIARFNSARKELNDSQSKINENTDTIKSEEEKAYAKLREGQEEIDKNRSKLYKIKRPEWYVLGRTKNAGYETYRQDSDRIDSIGKMFPLIFFMVAALVSLTTMTRMVQEKRAEIGTFKALGYSRTAIVSHYLIYSLSASAIGSLAGIFIGFKLFPALIMNAYNARYAIADKVVPFNSSLALQAVLIAVLFTAAAAVGSTMDELREVPASLMRPKPPKSGKTILLERVGFIWKRLNFTKKVTARNIFRYKQRLFMTVVGIAACTALMITGFGLKAGIIGAAETQFRDIFIYDMHGTLEKSVNDTEKNDVKKEALKDSNIQSIMFSYSKNATVKLEVGNDGKHSKETKAQDAYAVIPESNEELNKYINLSSKGNPLKLTDQGVIITRKLAKLVDKKVGDSIDLTIEDKTVKASLAAVTDNYVQHYIYISPAYYEKLIGSKVPFNSFYGQLNNTSEASEDGTSDTLKALGTINSVEFKKNTQTTFNKALSSINSVIPVLIVSAGVLAFVVIYNLTNINISERKRELATIKLLGFFNHELAAYIYRENMILTFLGSLAGIPLGILINRVVIATAETNDIMFQQNINPLFYLYSILLTLLFSVLVNLAMYSRFDKIDMIESLKSAE